MKQWLYMAADFETTVYEGQKFTEVWAAASVELYSSKVNIDQSIGGFLDRLFNIKKDIVCYFHNLKFDGNFILDYILRNGYSFKNVKNNDMKSKDFKCSISDKGQWYSIVIKKGSNLIEFRDSLKLLPFSLKNIGESFKLSHRKLEMEYEGFRYSGCEITESEKRYIENDVLVLKEALEVMFNEGHNKLTIGACCMEEFKRTKDKEEYQAFFPDLGKVLIDKSVYGASNADEYIRKSYRGGWCYLRKGMEGKHSNGWTADINSSYPSNMSSESGNYYPVGLPVFWSGNEIPSTAKNRYYFVRVKCRLRLRKNMLPTVQVKGNLLYNPNEYLETTDIVDYDTGKRYRYYIKDGKKCDTDLVITLTKTDYEMMLKHYITYNLEILDGCWFYQEIGIFDEYMYKYKEIKQNNKGAVRELAKLYLNNLYGKFASSDDSSYKEPYINAKNVLGFNRIEEHTKKLVHVAIGSAITSYARRFVIEAAQANYENFIYADTDSIHCTGDPNNVKGIKIHPANFCCWKMESYWDKAIFVRQKTYIEHITHLDGDQIEPYYNVKCAGMSEAAKSEFLEEHNIDEFNDKLELKNMLKPIRMPGGIVLVNKGYKMKPKSKNKLKGISLCK